MAVIAPLFFFPDVQVLFIWSHHPSFFENKIKDPQETYPTTSLPFSKCISQCSPPFPKIVSWLRSKYILFSSFLREMYFGGQAPQRGRSLRRFFLGAGLRRPVFFFLELRVLFSIWFLLLLLQRTLPHQSVSLL